MSLHIKIFLSLFVICLIWGSSWAAVKIGLETVPPIFSVALRLLLASTFLGAVIAVNKINLPRDRNFWILVLIMCITSFSVPFTLIYWAQLQINSGLASVLFATFPFWVALLSHFFLPDERIVHTRLFGIILGFIGIVVIFNDGFQTIGQYHLICMFAIVVSAILQAIGLVVLRRFGEHTNPIMLNFWSMLLSALLLLSASIIIDDYSNVSLTINAVGSLLYLSVFSTAFTFVMYFWLVKHIDAILLSLSAFITPIIAVFIGTVIMEENMTGSLYFGSSLVLIGVVSATYSELLSLFRLRNKPE